MSSQNSNIIQEELQQSTSLNNSICISSKLPVTDFNREPSHGEDTNFHRYKKYKWKFYILSVKESDRRENVEKLKLQLESKGIETEIIDAFYFKITDVVAKLNSKQITYDSPNMVLAQSQIGCFLSHRAAWERISEIEETIDEKKETLSIILEDDMDLLDPDNFNIDYLLEDIEKIENHKENPQQIDALVMWKHPNQFSNIEQKNKTENLLEFYYQWGLCAYCIKKKTAEELLKIKRFYQPVDEIVFRDIFPNMNVYFTKQEHFINLGGLTSAEVVGKKFQSLIWAW